jgi:hypothetical protein
MRIIACLALLSAGPLVADSVTDIQQSCGKETFLGRYWLLQCVQELLTAEPLHIGIGTLAPGAGVFAGGPAYAYIPRWNRLETSLSGSVLVSTDSSWLAQGQVVVAMPTIKGTGKFLMSRNATAGYGMPRGALRRDGELDAKSSFTLRARLFDLKQQAFYGIGPSTSRSNITAYSLKQFDITAGYNTPLTPWTSAGANADFIRPRIADPNSGTPIGTNFTVISDPGLTTVDDYLRFEPYLQFKIPARRSTSVNGRAGYSFYHALGDQRFSFRRLSASTIANIPLRPPVHVGSVSEDERDRVEKFLCPSSRSGEHCSLGDLTLTGRLDVTYNSAGSTSPFYLDPTLGGTDMNGNDTLRGFADYRFRAPNRILLQAEYRHPVWWFVGLVTFYDVGKVSNHPSDLTLEQLRHDIGLGFYISVANHEIARFYVAFGTGEPVRVHPKFAGVL